MLAVGSTGYIRLLLVLPAENSVQVGEFGLVSTAGGMFQPPPEGSPELPDVNCLAWHPKRMHIALGTSTGHVHVLSLPKDQSAWLSALVSEQPGQREHALGAVTCVATIQPHERDIRDIAFLPCEASRGELVRLSANDLNEPRFR